MHNNSSNQVAAAVAPGPSFASRAMELVVRLMSMEKLLSCAVTLDFHDTLFLCDDWFQLEVRKLPNEFFDWLAREPGQFSCDVSPTEITTRYRDIRHTAIQGGIEVDSVECVTRICHELDIELDRNVIAAGIDVLMRKALSTARPRPGAIELLQALEGTGVKLGVISNAIHHPFLEWALDRFGMLDSFDLVLSSAKAGFYKSRIELYQIASDMLAVSPEKMVHIGDSYRFDVVGASNAGMHTVWLNLTGAAADGVNPDLIVQSLDGLAPRLFDTFAFGPASQPGASHAL